MISVFGLVIADVLARRKGIEDADRLNRVRLLGAIGGASPMGVVVTSVLVDREAEATPAPAPTPPPAQPNNLVPTISSLAPSNINANQPGFVLNVNGANFVNGAIVRWNGADRPTTFVSATQLTAQIAPADVAAGGTAQVTVFNPAPGGGASPPVNFTVNNLAPAISSLAPHEIYANSPGFTLTVNGTNFVNGATVRWGGTNRTTTFISATQLTAAITSGDVATARTVKVTVFNPTPGGGVSNEVDFTIRPAYVANPPDQT
jgi:hypothetical protein